MNVQGGRTRGEKQLVEQQGGRGNSWSGVLGVNNWWSSKGVGRTRETAGEGMNEGWSD